MNRLSGLQHHRQSHTLHTGGQSNQQAVMVDSTGQQNTMIKSVKSGLPEEPAPIAVYAATPFNANVPASAKQPITAAGAEEKTDFKYFQRQVGSWACAWSMSLLLQTQTMNINRATILGSAVCYADCIQAAEPQHLTQPLCCQTPYAS